MNSKLIILNFVVPPLMETPIEKTCSLWKTCVAFGPIILGS